MGSESSAKKVKGSVKPSDPGGSKPRKTSGLMQALAPRLRELRFSLHLMSRSATSIAGVALIVILVFVAAFPFLLAPPEPGKDPFIIPINFGLPDPLPPSSQYPLGTLANGASISYGVVWGARISMTFAIEVVIIGALTGLVLGLFAGYFGGAVDEIIMRITDVFLSIPGLILIMAIAAVLGKGLGAMKIALVATWWSGYTRLIRGTALSVRENSYVDAARSAGSGELKIMFRHILPNAWSPVIVQATMDMGTVVLVLAGLGYLGLGVQQGVAEWGQMVNEGHNYLVQGFWWTVAFPGVAILVFVLAFNLMGDGLRDVLDPKMRR